MQTEGPGNAHRIPGAFLLPGQDQHPDTHAAWQDPTTTISMSGVLLVQAQAFRVKKDAYRRAIDPSAPQQSDNPVKVSGHTTTDTRSPRKADLQIIWIGGEVRHEELSTLEPRRNELRA